MVDQNAINTLHAAIINGAEIESPLSYTFEELMAPRSYQLPLNGHEVEDNALSLAIRYSRSNITSDIVNKFVTDRINSIIYRKKRVSPRMALAYELRNKPLLHLAANQTESQHSITILQTLIDTAKNLGFDMNKYLNEPYDIKKYTGYIRIVQEPHIPYSPLHFAAMRGSILVDTLLKSGADYKLPIHYSGKDLYAYLMPLHLTAKNSEATLDMVDTIRNSLYAFIERMQAKHDKISFGNLKDEIVTLLKNMYDHYSTRNKDYQTAILPILTSLYERLYPLLAIERDRRRQPEIIVRQFLNVQPHEPAHAKIARIEYEQFKTTIEETPIVTARSSMYQGL